MNFKQATDALLESVTLEDLAEAMGVSVQAIRQARAVETSAAFRSPPPKWEIQVKRLAERQSRRFDRLVREMGK
jgi:hypothetical protein